MNCRISLTKGTAIILSSIFTLAFHFVNAQDLKEKDNSKPTNVYSQIDNFIEFTRYNNYNTFGYNPKLTYTPNDANALSLEVPLLYTTKTDNFGLGDMRLRYFLVPYRDYTKFLGSFGASVDVILPTGKFEDGLGSSSWRFSPGLMFGLILNQSQTISAFPVISYIYTTEPTSGEIPEDLREADHGINFQIISSFVLSEDAFMLITPIYDLKNINDEREDEFSVEVESVFDVLQGKYQIGAFYRGSFQSNVHTFRVFFTVFI